MTRQGKAFLGALSLSAFITVCVYGLDSTLSAWLYLLIFVVSAYAIYGFAGKLPQQEVPPAATSGDARDETTDP